MLFGKKKEVILFLFDARKLGTDRVAGIDIAYGKGTCGIRNHIKILFQKALK